MANTNTPNGLQLLNNNPSGYTPKVTPYYISNAQAAMAVGTPVTLTGTANSANVIFGQEWAAGTLPGIQVATGGDGNKLLGAIVSFGTINPSSIMPAASASYNPATTENIAWVCDDLNAEFVILDNGTNALTVTDIGQNANLTIGTVNTFTGQDSTTLASGSVNTTATFQVKILRLNSAPNNVIGETNAEYVVKINNHLFGNIVAGV